MAKANVVVFGYHEVGYECLKVLLEYGSNVVALYTHPDDPNEAIWFKTPAQLARQHNIPVFMPDNPNSPDQINQLRALKPDLIFSFYYRHMICQEILDLPRLGAFNMHGSLLPKYRGRAPVNWAILHGEQQTGVTLHHMVKRPDAGDIVDQQAKPIGPQETAKEVFAKITPAARQLLQRQVAALHQGTAPRIPQDESQATYFTGRRPEDGKIDWTKSATQIFNLIRAVTHPYPGAFTVINGKRLFIWWAQPHPEKHNSVPGQILATNPLQIATGEGILEIKEAQWEGTNEIITHLVSRDRYGKSSSNE